MAAIMPDGSDPGPEIRPFGRPLQRARWSVRSLPTLGSLRRLGPPVRWALAGASAGALGRRQPVAAAPSRSTPSARHNTVVASRRALLDTAAVVTMAEPWNVPGNWCSSVDTPACSRRVA